MKFGVSDEFFTGEAEKFLDLAEVSARDGVIYWAETPVTESAKVTGMADILFRLSFEKYHKWANDAIESCDFQLCNIAPMRAAKLCIERKEMLTEKAYKKLLDYLKFIWEDYISTEHDFVGVNDNFPLVGTYTTMAMAQIFNDDALLRVTQRRLDQVESLLKRRGVLSEYMSGYTPFQLALIANIKKIAPTDEWKRTAQNVQDRIWFDFIAHYNDRIGTYTGPFAREYLAVGERETMDYFIYTLFEPDIQLELPDYALSFENLLFIEPEFECSDNIYELVRNKEYPFEFKATTECSASTDATPESASRNLDKDDNTYEYSAGKSDLYTYMTEYYGLGTATKEWHSGVQTSSFTLAYKRCKNPKKLSDCREMFCRYLLNDETVEEQRFFEQGRKTAFGMKNHAVVLYKPKIAAIPAQHNLDDNSRLAKHYRRQEISGNIGVTSAKLVLEIPLNGVNPDKILAGDKEISRLCDRFNETKSVYIKDGDVYLAIHPLFVTDKGRKAAMTVGLRDGMLEVALYNYLGQRRDFARRDFLHIRNGFAFTVSSADECDSFKTFVEKESKVIISDTLISTVHSRQTIVRSVKAEFDDMTLACEISPASEGIKYMTCNDFPIERPKLFATDFDMESLPYMK